MIRTVAVFLAIFVLAGAAMAQTGESKAAATAKEAAETVAENPKILMETSKGNLVIEFYPDKAPISVENFLAYVRDGFFDGTIFHRVIPGFVIQGGGFTADMSKKETKAAIKNEGDNGLKNTRGTLSMARTPEVDSATSQFFVNLVDNKSLDHRDKTARGYGYAVFAKVIEGMDVVDEIAKVSTTTKGPYSDVPKEAVTMVKVTVMGEKEN